MSSPSVASDVRLFVGLPVYGGYHAHFVPGLLDLVRNPPCPVVIAPLVGDSLVSRARNRLVAKFLKTDCTHLLFLDTDLIFSAAQVGRLISHGLPIVAGMYPKKQPQLAWVANTLPEFGKADPETGLQRILYAGTGCLLIAREVFEKMIQVFPEIAYGNDDGEEVGTYHDFFAVGPCTVKGRRRYLSEDWFFCQRAMDAGYEVFADTRVVLKHCGDAVYPLADPFTGEVES